jgi:polar amino acid transport system substrate-binding protein
MYRFYPFQEIAQGATYECHENPWRNYQTGNRFRSPLARYHMQINSGCSYSRKSVKLEALRLTLCIPEKFLQWNINMYKTLSALLVSFLIASNVAQAEKIVTLSASTSPPYSDRQLPEQGLALEIVSHVFKHAGYSPEVKFDIWPRAMEGVSVGLIDALASAWYSQERAEEYLFSEPYITSKLILLKLRSDRSNYSDVLNLRGKRVGTQVDFAYGVNFDAVEGLQLVPENHAIQNLLGLLNDKVDVVIGDQRTLAMQLHSYLGGDIQKFEVVDIGLPSRDRYVAASRAIEGEEELIARFNKALAETRKDGSYQAIVSKWDKLHPVN